MNPQHTEHIEVWMDGCDAILKLAVFRLGGEFNVENMFLLWANNFHVCY